MAGEPAPVLEADIPGYPAAVVVGGSVSLKLFIAGEPVPKDRPRGRVVIPKGGRPFVQFYEEKKSAEWTEHVAEEAKGQVKKIPVAGQGQDFVLPLQECRVIITIRYNLTKPKSYPKRIIWPTKKPDSDNLEKAVLDGLVQGRIIADDALVTDTYHYKRYADEQHPAGIEIDLTAIPCEV